MPVYSHNGITPTLGNGVYLAPTATVVGDVVIGDQSSLWFNTVIRGDVFSVRIGARTNIQDGTIIHVSKGTAATTIGDDVTVGHLALIHGCTIGNRVLVGMGSIILDGAILEDDCFIGAGSLVSPGTRVPARSLVMGRPARKTRTLGDADLANIRAYGLQYLEHSRDYAETLTLVQSRKLG